MTTVAGTLQFPAEAPVSTLPLRQRSVMALLLIILTVIVYLPLFSNKFIHYDDATYIYLNPHVRSGVTAKSLSWAVRTHTMGHWHPLTWFSYMLIFNWFGDNPAGYHLTNLLLHCFNVVLVFLMLQRGTGESWRSAFVAAVFAVHPLNVETVAWAAELKSGLSTFFGLLAIAAYGSYLARPGWQRYVVMVTYFALSLMAKSMLVTLPFALLLLDYWPLGRMDSTAKSAWHQAARLIGERVPLLLLSAASSVVAYFAAKSNGSLASLSVAPLKLRLQNALYSYSQYIIKFLWPHKLSIFYPYPENLSWRQLAPAIALLLVLTMVAVRYFRSKPWLFVGWCWYLGMLVPVIGIVQNGRVSMAERFAYVPMLGLLVMLIWSVDDWAGSRRLSPRVIQFAAGGVLLTLAAVSYAQVARWHDDFSLFGSILRHSPQNPVANKVYGIALADRGRLDEAANYFLVAEAADPRDPEIHYALGRYHLLKNEPAKAIAEYELSLRWKRGSALAASAHRDMGDAFEQMGDRAAAKAHYRAAIDLDPDNSTSYVQLGVLLYSEGSLSGARELFSRAAQLEPNAYAHYWLGRILEDENRISEALGEYRAALKIFPPMLEARQAIERIQPRQPPDR